MPTKSSPPYNKDAERHFLPPKTSQMMAETHGMFDSPPAGPAETWYQVITETDVSLPMDPKPPYDPLPQTPTTCACPICPIPWAQGATFVGLPGYATGQPFTAATWGGHWPYLRHVQDGAQGHRRHGRAPATDVADRSGPAAHRGAAQGRDRDCAL